MPLVWGSVGLRVVTLSYPLKTSLENGTLSGGVPYTVRAGLEVSGIRGAGNDGVLGVGRVLSVRWIGAGEHWELSTQHSSGGTGGLSPPRNVQ